MIMDYIYIKMATLNRQYKVKNSCESLWSSTKNSFDSSSDNFGKLISFSWIRVFNFDYFRKIDYYIADCWYPEYSQKWKTKQKDYLGESKILQYFGTYRVYIMWPK